jgi:hypothetical protein
MVSGAAMGGKYYRGGMRIMPKNAERLFNLPEDNHDDRNVAQQLADLGVTVERTTKPPTAKTLTDWIKPRGYGQHVVQDVRVGKKTLSMSPKTVNLFLAKNGEHRVMMRIVDYNGKPALFLKPDNSGWKLSRSPKSLAYMMQLSGRIKELFKEHNVKQGKYTLHEIKAGYLAVHDGE